MQNLAHSFTMRKDGIAPRGDWFRIENKANEPAKVYIYDEIGFWGTAASDFTKQLNEITASEIHVHLNSPGGEIFDGLAIYSALQQHKATVTIYVDGLAASAASFIAQAGDKVVMSRFAQMMIHDGIAFAYGNEQDMLDTAELLSKLSNNIADIYHVAAKNRGALDNSLEYFRGLMRAETWMNGQEAVDFGLADEVTQTDNEDEAATASNKWDLSFYNYAGRDRAESPSRVAARAMLEKNDNKESQMAGLKNTTDPAVAPAPVPDTTPPPEPAQPTGDPDEPGTEAQPQDDPVTPPTQPEAPAAKAGQQGVLINGKLVTDWAEINKHFAVMQTAQAEQQAQHRKNFIEGLASSNKIAATQIDSLVALVNGDATTPGMSDAQFAAFQASYESTAPSNLLGGQPGTLAAKVPGMPGIPAASDKGTRIETLKSIVDMHRRTMPKDQLEKTNSYIELQQLLGANES